MLRRLAVMGCLGTLLPILIVLAGLAAIGDIAARHYATSQLGARIRTAVPEARGVSARIHSFPFLGHIAWDGSVGEVGAHINRFVGVGGLDFTDLDVDLHGVVIDKGELFSHHKVRLTRIGRGTVRVEIPEQSLTAALGRPVHITSSGVSVDVAGREVPVGFRLIGARSLVVDVAGLRSFTEALPPSNVMPCVPALGLADGTATLSCTFARVPDAFVQAAARA